MDFVTQSELAFVQKRWRITAGVRNVCLILANALIPISVQDIGKILKEQNHPVDATTVYRILERLKECHLIHSLHEGRFVKCSDVTNKKAHHFLRCQKCGSVEEIFLDYKKSMSSQLATEKNFLLTDVDLEFWGICQACTK
jgi:Fur family transcriptional regulator, ferric uptake regulator